MSNRRLWMAGGAGALLILICASILIWNTTGKAQPLLSAAQIGDEVQAKYPGEITSVVQNNDTYQVKLESATGVYEVTVGATGGEVRSIRQLEGTRTVDATTNPDSKGSTSSSTSSTATSSTSSEANATDTTKPSSDTATGNKTATGTEDTKDSSSDSSVSSSASTSSSNTNSTSTSTDTRSELSTKEASSSESSRSASAPSSSSSTSATSSPAVRPYTVTALTEKQAEQIALRQVKGEVDDVKFKHSGKTGQQYYLVEIDTSDDREATVQINGVSGAVMSVTWDDEDDSDDKGEDS